MHVLSSSFIFWKTSCNKNKKKKADHERDKKGTIASLLMKKLWITFRNRHRERVFAFWFLRAILQVHWIDVKAYNFSKKFPDDFFWLITILIQVQQAGKKMPNDWRKKKEKKIVQNYFCHLNARVGNSVKHTWMIIILVPRDNSNENAFTKCLGV